MHNVPKARLLPPVKFEQICRIVVVVCFARLHIFVICIDTKIQRRCGGGCRRLSDYLITTKVIIPSAIAPRRVHSKGLFPSAASFVATAEDGIARSPMGLSVLTTMSLQVAYQSQPVYGSGSVQQKLLYPVAQYDSPPAPKELYVRRSGWLEEQDALPPIPAQNGALPSQSKCSFSFRS
jgi:hypothetical protein